MPCKVAIDNDRSVCSLIY